MPHIIGRRDLMVGLLWTLLVAHVLGLAAFLFVGHPHQPLTQLWWVQVAILFGVLVFVCRGFRAEYSRHAFAVLPYLGMAYELVTCAAIFHIFLHLPSVGPDDGPALAGRTMPWLFVAGMGFMVLCFYPSFALGRVGTTAYVLVAGSMLFLMLAKYVMTRTTPAHHELVAELALLGVVGFLGTVSRQLFG